jgi:hypothetical protein
VLEGPALPCPIDEHRLVTALVLADLAGLAILRSEPRQRAVPA